MEWTGRLDLVLPRSVSERQRRELGAFARYCAGRVERELGTTERWSVSLRADAGIQYTSTVSVADAQGAIVGRGVSSDAVLAIWEAMCQLEQRLREHLATSRVPAPAA
jgi:hypothetical protein